MAKVKNDDLRIRWKACGDYREGRAPGLQQPLRVHLLLPKKGNVREAGIFYGGNLVEKLPCADYDLTAAKARAQELVATFVALDDERNKERARAAEAQREADRARTLELAAEAQREADRARALELAAEVRRMDGAGRPALSFRAGVQLADVVMRLLEDAQ